VRTRTRTHKCAFGFQFNFCVPAYISTRQAFLGIEHNLKVRLIPARIYLLYSKNGVTNFHSNGECPAK